MTARVFLIIVFSALLGYLLLQLSIASRPLVHFVFSKDKGGQSIRDHVSPKMIFLLLYAVSMVIALVDVIGIADLIPQFDVTKLRDPF